MLFTGSSDLLVSIQAMVHVVVGTLSSVISEIIAVFIWEMFNGHSSEGYMFFSNSVTVKGMKWINKCSQNHTTMINSALIFANWWSKLCNSHNAYVGFIQNPLNLISTFANSTAHEIINPIPYFLTKRG